MSEPSARVPEQPPADVSGLRRTANAVGIGLGCLGLLAGGTVVAFGVLAFVLDDPTFAIAMGALIVAVAAYRASKRGR